MKKAVLVMIAVGLAACGGEVVPQAQGGGSDGGGTPTPAPTATGRQVGPTGTPGTNALLGTFANCTILADGDTFAGAGNPVSTLTLTPSGILIVATYRTEGQPDITLDLTPTSDTSATLTTTDQGFPAKWGYCGGGVSANGGVADPAPAEATLNLSSAAVTLDHGFVFLAMSGTVIDVQGSEGCAADTEPSTLSATFVCGTGGAPAAAEPLAGGEPITNGDGVVPPAATFVAGAYDCVDSTDSVVTSGGETSYSGDGGSGTLNLAVAGSSLTAVYSGDYAASGTLTFTTTSDSSAKLDDGQTVAVACGIIGPIGSIPTETPVPTEVSSGALTTDGTTLFLTFLGAVAGGTCAGQTSSTALQCTPAVP